MKRIAYLYVVMALAALIGCQSNQAEKDIESDDENINE